MVWYLLHVSEEIMLINGTTLKEKSLCVESFMPVQNMHVKMDRVSSFPPKVENEKDFNCSLEYSVKIQDDDKKTLVKIKVSYLILAQLEKDEEYNQELCADRMFNALKPMFVKSINDMLRETAFPALPLKVGC